MIVTLLGASRSRHGPASPPPPPPLLRRRAANTAIVVLLALQAALPLRYYLTGRGSDERFAWRMFSAERVERCDFRVLEVPHHGEPSLIAPAELRSRLHVGWINLLARGRPAVVDAWLERSCDSGGLSEVRWERRCAGVDGAAKPVEKRALRCKGGARSGGNDW